ncbi:MAG: alpha-L-fucosidase [Kiritimatiellae bacterium]|nr:alpha-L-fucosidase [Kiritimatiellia bacterium]
MKRYFLTIVAAVCVCSLNAKEPNPNTDWFSKAGYGVFVHYLQELQNNPDQLHSLGQKSSWDECVNAFDVDLFADQMKQAGAGYVVFTTHQRTQFLIAPNATFDRLTGYKPGEACSHRDLIAELADALEKRGIPLMLYWTGNGPSSDPKASQALGFETPVTAKWAEIWGSVVAEYGKRYGDRIKGWWVDGCYFKHGNLKWTDDTLGILAKALKEGNPKRIIALNPGVELAPYSIHEDYIAGEMNSFEALPESRFLEGRQWHILSFLGPSLVGNYLAAGWGRPGVNYSLKDFVNYLGMVNAQGGVVSIDVMLYRDGRIDFSQLEFLKRLRPALKQWHDNSAPMPSGNMAYRKPAKLLNIAGQHSLKPNGGSGGDFQAWRGLDGNPATAAMASGEWAWCYQVDLLNSIPVSRVKVNFGHRGYATHCELLVSSDCKEWKRVGGFTDGTGKPFDCDFEKTNARYVRVKSLKPDGPDQKGYQMSVAELEVYD